MHRGDARGTQVGLQAQVEVGGVHAHEDIGAVLQQPLAQLPADAHDAQQLAHQLQAVAVHGQPLAGPPGIEAAALHLRAADAQALHARPALLQAVQQQTRQQIAGGLTGHHGDAGHLRRHRRRLGRKRLRHAGHAGCVAGLQGTDHRRISGPARAWTRR